MDPHGGHGTPHEPTPTLWPAGFAVGIVCVLLGLVITNWLIAAVGAGITAVFAFLWVRDATREYRVEPAPPPPEPAPAPPPTRARTGPPAIPEPGEGEIVRFPRSKFLEAATLGVGGVIGGIVTAPVAGFAVLPAFIHQGHKQIDVGPVTDFPENKFVVTTFLLKPEEGEVSRRTAYIRNNGFLQGKPSFTILSNRCVHLGCPVQLNGLLQEQDAKTIEAKTGEVRLIPSAVSAGFGCPCHGGQYDEEGNRVAGPPVRALDRFEFEIRDGRLLLGKTYSVSKVKGTGAEAKIRKYGQAGPGQHVDGPEAWFYPLQPPR